MTEESNKLIFEALALISESKCKLIEAKGLMTIAERSKLVEEFRDLIDNLHDATNKGLNLL